MQKEFKEKYPNAFSYKAHKPSWVYTKINFSPYLNLSLWVKIKCFLSFILSFVRYNLGIAKKNPIIVSFGCGEGWKSLVEEVAKELNEHDEATFAQVKEKFGLLRIYLNQGNKDLYLKISNLEKESSKICEECGSRENVKTEGRNWIKTYCDTCRDKINKDNRW